MRSILTERRHAHQNRVRTAAYPEAKDLIKGAPIRISRHEKPQPYETFEPDYPLSLTGQPWAQTRKHAFINKAAKGIKQNLTIRKVTHKEPPFEELEPYIPNIDQRRFSYLNSLTYVLT
jgi:hypothetical protein